MGLKEQLQQLDAEDAKRLLTKVGDMMDGSDNGEFSAEEVRKRIEAEVMRGNTRIAANPFKAAVLTVGGLLLAYAAGGVTVWLLVG